MSIYELFFRRRKLKLGDERIHLKPLTLENALRLILLLAPYLALIEEKWPDIRRALSNDKGQRPQLLFALFQAMRAEMALMPGDMTQALALLIDRDPIWVAANVKAKEFLEALPILDEINDFIGLWESAQGLGLIVRRRNGKSRTD